MKKICLFGLTLALALSMSLAVSADPGNFVSSPSGNQAPVLVEYDNATEDCPATLTVTSYADRDQLPEDAKNALENAYAQISDHKTNLSALNDALLTIAADLGVDITDLAVSDLFDISRSDCDSHEGHGAFDLVLKAETLNNFACLLHYTNGAWVVVDDAQVTQNGEHLEFSVEDLSPFAIVVNTAAVGGDTTEEETTDAPATEEPTEEKKGISDYITTGSAAVVAVSAVVLAGSVISYVKFRKQDDDYDDYYD